MHEAFFKKYEIGKAAMVPGLTVAPSDMLDILQELATIHSDELGFTMDYFMTEQKGWALLSWNVEFGPLPKWRDEVRAETWATDYERLIATRNFRILDKDGNALLKSVSKWIYMDKQRRRPVRPPKEMLNAYFSERDNLFEYKKIEIPPITEMDKIGGSSFTVKRSHTDSNFHVNNIKYVVWAEDELPDEVFRGNKIKSIYVNYRKETTEGVHVQTKMYNAGKGRYVCIIKDDKGTILAEIVMDYSV